MMRVVSLRFTGTIVLLLVILLVSVLTFWFVNDEHERELAKRIALTKETDEEALQTQILQVQESLMVKAEELAVISELSTRTPQDGLRVLQQYWNKISLTSPIQHIRLVSPEGTLWSVGKTDSRAVRDITFKVAKERIPQQRLDCQVECMLVVAVPVKVSGRPMSLGLVSDFGPVLQGYSQLDVAGVGVFEYAGQADNKRQLWGMGVPMLTDAVRNEALFPMLNELDKDQVFGDGVVVKTDGEQYFVWGKAFAQSNGRDLRVIFFEDLSAWLTQRREHTRTLFIFTLAISLSILVVTILFFAGPLKRLQKLVPIIDHVGKKEYDKANSELQESNSGLFADEIDAVFSSMEKTIGRLNKYEKELMRSHEKLHTMAMEDPLTGLANRNAFMLDLQRMKIDVKVHRVALLFMDLDGFKPVNDNLGHGAGDEVLSELGRRLLKLGEDDSIIVYRLGGDEFAIQMRDVANQGQIEAVIERVFNKLAKPIELGSMSVSISASIGVAFRHTDHPMFDDLLRHADIAMYQAKRDGKNRFRLFDDSMETESNLQFRVNNEFAASLVQGQVSVFYQPIIDIRSSELIKMEALARWQHPDLGAISPGLFIPVLEESGLISTLTRWLIDEVVKQLKILDAMGLNELRIAVNISGQQITDAGYLQQLAATLEEQGLSCNRLELEITETSLIRDFDRGRDWVELASELGFKVAIDDFGTGYSSLSYLTAIPFDTVKLDRSLISNVVNDTTQQKVVGSIGQMLHSLGVDVVAEGIETHEQLNMLNGLHCDYAQGYLIAMPMDVLTLNTALEGYAKRRVWYVDN